MILIGIRAHYLVHLELDFRGHLQEREREPTTYNKYQVPSLSVYMKPGD